ncbi:HAD-IIB family hydrolase [Loigolactobacillus binensis]|uniref:HAD-IIB family hydrolase n=1 Tax=Loigolactobacillus binensis TaxID=2559922 RepID=A0ABW3EGL0_9LACO|nr:HAD-IIB family hydrolase [Loigolactobacillus binensis]
MSIKMVVVDMDGTFLNQQDTYDKHHFMALFKRIKQAGIHFVVASGSQYQRLQSQFAAVKNELDFISQNGAIVHSGTELLAVDAIKPADLAQTFAIMRQDFPANAIVQRTVSGLSKTYIDRQISPTTYRNIHRYYYALEKVDDLATISAAQVHDQLTKISLTFAPQLDYATAVKQLRAALPATLMSQNSGFNTELIGNTGIDKLTGLHKLQQRYHIADDEMLTFGDNENDLAMLTATPYGFAMKNAAATFRRQAPNVTAADNDHDGVLATIEQFI